MAEQTLNIKFVQEIKKHPCLYNNTLSEYSRKDIIDKGWNDVGKEVNLSGSECKEKWKNLRAVFVRNTKSTKTRRPYYLSEAMQFILPYIKTSNRRNSGHQLQAESEHEVYVDQDENSSQKLDPLIPPFQSAQQSNQFNQIMKTMKRPKDDDSDDSFVEYFRAKKEKLEADTDSHHEANKMFLLSLMPDLDQMSLNQVRAFKRKVLDIIDVIMETASNNEYS